MPTFLPQPQTKTDWYKRSPEDGTAGGCPCPFPQSRPHYLLRGCSNKATVIVDGQRVTILINLGAQVLSISFQFCEDLTLQFQPLGRLLELEGMAYVEVNLQIPGIKNYNKDILLLVKPTTTYSKKFPVLVGSKIIDWSMGVITKEELMKATTIWRQDHLGLSCLGHCSCLTLAQGKLGWRRRISIPPQGLTL